jgi:hypothetical protein
MKPLVPLVFDPLLGQTAQEAAEAALVLLRDEALEGRTGGLFLKIGKLKQVLATGRFAPEEARRLWDLSQRLTARSPPPASAPSRQTPATDPSFPGGNSILAPR